MKEPVNCPATPTFSGIFTRVLTPVMNVDWFTPLVLWTAVLTEAWPGTPMVATPMLGVAVRACAPPCVIETARSTGRQVGHSGMPFGVFGMKNLAERVG